MLHEFLQEVVPFLAHSVVAWSLVYKNLQNVLGMVQLTVGIHVAWSLVNKNLQNVLGKVQLPVGIHVAYAT
jgi:hydroxymethylglutaryl-CoA reductase